MNEFEKAVKYYRELKNENPKSKYAWNGLGLALEQVNRLEESIECFHQAI